MPKKKSAANEKKEEISIKSKKKIYLCLLRDHVAIGKIRKAKNIGRVYVGLSGHNNLNKI